MEAIEVTTAELLQAGQPIVRAQQIQLAVAEKALLEVDTKLVRQVLRKDLRMGYR